MTKLLQKKFGTHTTEATNCSIFVLAIVVVLAFTINQVTGLLSMNVGGISLAGAPHSFWIVLGIIFTPLLLLSGWSTKDSEIS